MSREELRRGLGPFRWSEGPPAGNRPRVCGAPQVCILPTMRRSLPSQILTRGQGCVPSPRRSVLALALASFVIASLLQGAGCTRHVRLPAGQMREGTVLERSRVFLRGGREYRFESVTFTPDSLVGRYRVLQETGTEREGIRFAEVLRTYPVALAEVDSVLLEERDLRRGILYGAGIGALAGIVYILVSGDDSGGSGSDGGRPDIPVPLR